MGIPHLRMSHPSSGWCLPMGGAWAGLSWWQQGCGCRSSAMVPRAGAGLLFCSFFIALFSVYNTEAHKAHYPARHDCSRHWHVNSCCCGKLQTSVPGLTRDGVSQMCIPLQFAFLYCFLPSELRGEVLFSFTISKSLNILKYYLELFWFVCKWHYFFHRHFWGIGCYVFCRIHMCNLWCALHSQGKGHLVQLI